jgi:hypothetical protein
MKKSGPVFIAPECHVPGCRQAGDQFTMVKCRYCDHWFCAEHLNSRDTIRRSSIVETGLRGLSYYIGVCADCSEKQAQKRRPVGSTWLH